MRGIAALVFVSLLSLSTPLGSRTFLASVNTVPHPLWETYERSLRDAKYVDLTHSIAPGMTVWAGFGAPTCRPAFDPKTNRPYSYNPDGFEANQYTLPTDQLGTQLDPPAHWNPDFPAIDELPATFAVRPLCVISIAERVAVDPGYSLQVSDIKAWEMKFGRIP